MLDLSTAHMPSTSPFFGDLRVLDFEYGYVVFVSPAWLEGETAEEWLLPIMRKAVAEDCTVILFDRDAEKDEEFKTYDW
jgi:hypothetical protein